MKRLLTAAALACFAAGCSSQSPVAKTAAGPPAAAFTLRDQDGKPQSVGTASSSATALYFGYTHCKDVCPQTLAMLGRARAQAHLTAQQLRIVMVTVDPARDSRAALKAFVQRTGVKMSALRGSNTQLHRIYKAYGVVIQPQGRDLGHTDYAYLIDRHARLSAVVSDHTALNEVARRLRSLLN
ncbi:MAG: SCO family protein [Candidatus Baltobacteraceae bacterium]